MPSIFTDRRTAINNAVNRSTPRFPRQTSPTIPNRLPTPSAPPGGGMMGAVDRAISGSRFSQTQPTSQIGQSWPPVPVIPTPVNPTPVNPTPTPSGTPPDQRAPRVQTINPVPVNDLPGPVQNQVWPGPNPIAAAGTPNLVDPSGPNKSVVGKEQFGDYAETDRNQFDIRRERVAADAAEEEKRRMAAIERQLAASGIDDSGVLQGQQRTEAANIRNAAGRAMQDVDIAEDQNRLAERGMSLQEKSQADSVRLAESGLDLQASAQELQRQGMNQQDAQYYAGLGQARYLAQQGLDQGAIALRLQEQGMSQQDAQFYAGLNLQREGITQDIQKAIIVDQMTKIDPSDPQYLTKLSMLLNSLSGLDNVITREYAGPRGGTTEAGGGER